MPDEKEEQMMMLTLREAKFLAFIAHYPKSSHSKKLLAALSGEAREIGLILMGKSPNPTPERQEIAEAFKDAWTKH